MTIQYRQRLWDAGSGGRWVYYEKSAIDPAPLSGETSPNYTGAISAHSVLSIRDDGVVDVPGLDVVLDEWNGTDLTQWGPVSGYKNDFSTGPIGTPGLALVAGSGMYTGHQLLRMTVADDGGGTLSGGYFYPFIFSGALPTRYIIEVEIAGFAATGSCTPHIVLMFYNHATLANRRGVAHHMQADGSNYVAKITTNGVTSALSSRNQTGTWSGNHLAVGLSRKVRWEVRRPDGEATSAWAIAGGITEGATSVGGGGGNTDFVGGDNSVLSALPSFDGLTFDTVGIGVYNNNVSGFVTGFDILAFRVLQHPLDA